jgi:uncharacterized protein YbjT (DUF2867 family)
MPVLVTAAHQPLARRIATRLLDEGGEVRVVADGDVSALRAAGAFVATGTIDDEGRLEAALAQVHTVVHVGGGLLTRDPGRIVVAAETLARAAAGAGVARIIMLSLPGAHPGAADPIRRAKARAEEVLTAVPCPTVVIRAGLVDGPAVRDALVTAGLPPEVLATAIAPVRATDLIEMIAAFDRARSSTADGRLFVAADGPLELSVAGYLDRVGAGQVSRVGRRLPDRAVVERLAAVLTGPWKDEGPGRVDGWSFADHQPEVPGVG